MSTADQPDALVRRLEQLAAAADDGSGHAGPRAVEARLAVLEDAVADRLSSALAARDEELRRTLLDAVGSTVDLALRELRRDLLGAVADLRDDVGRTVAELRAGAAEQAEQLTATFARCLSEVADEVDVAATTARHTSQQVTVLAEVTEAQRAEVAQLLRGAHDDVVDTARALRGELLAHTTEELGALGRRLDALDAAVANGAADVGERLGALEARTTSVADTVEGFRAEWPTRTYEVVQGARAVAEAVVLDVREEIGARLQEVRTTLEQVVGGVEPSRSRPHAGSEAPAVRSAGPAASDRSHAPAPRPGVARGGRGGAAVVPGPGRAAGARTPRQDRDSRTS